MLDGVWQYGSDLMRTGDFNELNSGWLGIWKTTEAGELLEDISALHHLTQHITELTRGSNILEILLPYLTGVVDRYFPSPCVIEIKSIS